MTKLYGDFEKADWLRVSQIKEEEIPHTIILHGEDGNIVENIAEWEPSFDGVICRPQWNMIIGKKSNRHIGFVNVCWAPMAALIVHKYAMLGTQRFIQIGYCGGLSKELRYGDILIVSRAKGEDGVSSAYLPGQMHYEADPTLVSRAETFLDKKHFRYRVGEVVSTSAMFLETSARVEKWASEGLVGVDGETAATFAVARKFRAEAIGLLTCSDNLILGDNFWEMTKEREHAEDTALERIRELALALS